MRYQGVVIAAARTTLSPGCDGCTASTSVVQCLHINYAAMVNILDNDHPLAQAYEAVPEHKLAEVLTKAILLQKLADTTEKLVQLSEHAKKLTELQHA